MQSCRLLSLVPLFKKTYLTWVVESSTHHETSDTSKTVDSEFGWHGEIFGFLYIQAKLPLVWLKVIKKILWRELLLCFLFDR